MGKTTIRMGLSVGSVKDAIRQVRAYKESLNEKCGDLCRRLAEEGVTVAQMQVQAFPAVDTGELLGSIDMKPGDSVTDGSRWIVYTGCPYAKYVEFGTGIVGASSPHPDPEGWDYDVNGHGDKGWFYKGRDGAWHWTKGMPARPFMYNTAMELRSRVSDIAREVFG